MIKRFSKNLKFPKFPKPQKSAQFSIEQPPKLNKNNPLFDFIIPVENLSKSYTTEGLVQHYIKTQKIKSDKHPILIYDIPVDDIP